MPDCELMPTCPFFNDEWQETAEMTARLKEEYCRGNYGWCGRYMLYKALERDEKNGNLLACCANEGMGQGSAVKAGEEMAS